MADYQKYAELRDAAGMNDYQVAKAAQVDSSAISNWKAGRYSPKVDKLMRIADAVGVDIKQLL